MRLRAVFVLASACFTVGRAIHRAPLKDSPSAQVSLHPSWADVVSSSLAWWKSNRRSGVDMNSSDSFNHAKTISDLLDEPPDLGISPLGDSPWNCDAALPYQGVRECTSGLLEKFRSASLAPEIVDGSEVTGVMDLGMYVAKDVGEGLAPCRVEIKPPAWAAQANRIDIVFDAQYSNQPRCCPLKDLPSGDAAGAFKDGESTANNSDDIDTYTMDGIRFGRGSTGIVYSLIEPASVTCSEHSTCPVVVELPGAATVPWLLLQAWCTGCSRDLGTIVVSMDNVEDPSWSFVEDHFIPTVQEFLNSRRDVNHDRVYLVSTSKGNEVGLLAALLHPEVFNFGLFAGKFLITEDIKKAAKLATKAEDSRLRMISFHVGSDDKIKDDMQDFWSKLQNVVKPVALPMQMELRYYPGGSHAMWYAAWNAYHGLLWTGAEGLDHYLRKLVMTCSSS